MEIILQTYYTLLPIVATTLIGWVGYVLKEQHRKEKLRETEYEEKEKETTRIRNANSHGTMLILRYMLNRYHTEYMVQGKMSYSQYKDWIDLFDAYTALGGNSIAVEWNKDIEELEKCDSVNGSSLFESMVRNSIDHKK